MGLFSFLQNISRSNTYVTRDTIEKVQREWHNIDVLLNGGAPSQLKQALISADRSLDSVLKDIVAGETMGERLKNSFQKFEKTTYNKIWDAHKMRNSLVHESDFEPPHFILKEKIEVLRQAVKSLGVNV